jgi:hypothetical protein
VYDRHRSRLRNLDYAWTLTHSKVYLGSVFGRILDVLAFKGYMVRTCHHLPYFPS